MSNHLNLIYDIPAELAAVYQGKAVILRTVEPGALLSSLDEKELDFLVNICIEDLDCDLAALKQSDHSPPLDLLVKNPEVDFPKLYAFSELAESYPIRARISLGPGLGKAVRVAAALHFAVKIDVGQPEDAAISDLLKVLDLYFHGSGVTEPVEFFHSLLLARYHDHPTNLWSVQEEDPLVIRHVDVHGREAFPGRLAGCEVLPADTASHLDCRGCSFLSSCAGFFKWPDHNYDCKGIKKIFARIEAAAAQLHTDIAATNSAQEDHS